MPMKTQPDLLRDSSFASYLRIGSVHCILRFENSGGVAIRKVLGGNVENQGLGAGFVFVVEIPH
jgi:hypothetical protein